LTWVFFVYPQITQMKKEIIRENLRNLWI